MICHPLLLTAIGLSLQAQDTLQYDALVYGKITSADTRLIASISPPSQPIASVIIEVSGPGNAVRQLTGDDAGTYSLPGLAAGVYTLRFARTGFIPLVIDVRVPAHGSVHLDVTLDRAPPLMQTIKVLATDDRPRIADIPMSTGAYRPWHIDGNQMRASPSLDAADVIRAVGTSPDATAGPESGSGLHLQGGATNHTLLLVDGIPLYNAVHAGDHPSAIDPDAVAGVTSYSEPRARSGGRLSGVVEVDTRTTLPDSQHVATTIWPTGIRTLTQMQFGDASALLGARRNYARPLQANTHEAVTLRPNDVFATASVPFVDWSLTALLASSTDAVSFDAGPLDLPAGSRTANRFDWTSDARALTWHRVGSTGFSMDARAWQSSTSVGANWVPLDGNALRMANQFTQTAASTTTSWAHAHSTTSLGVSLEQLRGRYSVANTASADEASLIGVAAQLRVASAFVEHTREMGRFTTTIGERAAIVRERLFLEPRAAAAVSLFDGITLSGAFARTHQYTQSLYNDESAVDAMATLEVPVVAGTAGVPVAVSTSGSLQLDVPLGSSTSITASTFARTFDALVLAGPSGGDPFAAHAFTAGHGEAYGASFGVREQLGRLDLQGLYSMSSVSREWAGEHEYRPTFAPSNDLLVSAGYQAGENTLLRASGFMSAIRSTSPLFGAVAWQWQDALASQRQVSGSPQYSPAALGMGRLAPYLRIDLGVRHTFAFGRSFRASVYANVDNLLDRRNAAGLMEDQSGTGTRVLRMMPRSLSFGLSLRF